MEIDLFAKTKKGEKYLCTMESYDEPKHAIEKFNRIMDKDRTLVPQTRKAWLKHIGTKKYTIIARIKEPL